MNSSHASRQDDFRPTASSDHLRLRADLLRRVRQFFHPRGFLEVETPLLSADTVIDRHIDPVPVTLFEDPRSPNRGRTMWLQTSPEPAMKRLLAAGAEAVYQVTRAFRAGECGRLHNPEFTLVEWYRRGDSLAEGIQLVSQLCDALLGKGPAERLSYREAFQRDVGTDPFTASIDQLAHAARRLSIQAPATLSDDRDSWLDLLMTGCVQPHLGCERPTILFDYPATQAALAQIRHDDPPVAERFELYVRGIELANGYHELSDPAQLRERNAAVNRQRVADGKYRLPEDSRLLDAMEHGLPECTGVALGFDRLVMVAAGANSLAEVMAFPIDRA